MTTTSHSAERAQRLLHAGNVAEAETVLTAALAAAPEDPALHRLLVDVLHAGNQLGRAIKACKTLAALTPNDARVRVKAAQLRAQNLDHAGATTDFEAALALDPGDVLAMDGLANLARLYGDVDNARAILRRRAEASTDPQGRAASRLKEALTQPVIARDIAEIDAARAHFADFLARGPETAFDDPWALGLGPNFYLGYQARDDRPLQEALAAYYIAATPTLTATATHVGVGENAGKRTRIGIVSNFFSKHTVGYLSYGLIAGLDRERFEVILFRTPHAARDSETPRFLAVAPCVDLPADLAAARAKIAEAKCDILHYPEIGMDHFAYFLAFARLADVQTVAWGHPITTGIPNIDLFLSVDAMEPPDGDAHYSERLVRLKTLSFAGAPPLALDETLPTPMDTKRPSYFCAQSLYKLHPDFDTVIERVLREDREGVVYLISYGSHADATLKARLARALRADSARVKILARTTRHHFLQLLKAADVVLDVPQWSGGKTSLETFAQGTPVVHMPGAFMRGRHALAFYRRMGIDAPVVATPEAYAATAVRLVHDRAFRTEVRGLIAARQAALFNDADSIREIEEVWIAALRARR